MHTRVKLSTKFQLKLTILIFWIKFAQKVYLRSKTEKFHFCVRSQSLLTIITFPRRGRQTQRHFNVPSPSSRIDNNMKKTTFTLVLFSRKITFSLKKKTTLQKQSLQLRKQMSLESQRIYIDQCSSMKNETILMRSLDIHSLTNAKGEIASSISMWNIANQLSKHDFSYGLIFLEGRK